MRNETPGYVNCLDTLDGITAAQMQATADYNNISEMVATVLGHYDCDGAAIVVLEVALHDYFFELEEAYSKEVNRRLEEMCRATNITSEAEEE